MSQPDSLSDGSEVFHDAHESQRSLTPVLSRRAMLSESSSDGGSISNTDSDSSDDDNDDPVTHGRNLTARRWAGPRRPQQAFNRSSVWFAT